jgi:hypothetical protein
MFTYYLQDTEAKETHLLDLLAFNEGSRSTVENRLNCVVKTYNFKKKYSK